MAKKERVSPLYVFNARMGRFLNYKHLLYELVIRDLKVKYRRSFLGYLWSLLNPLLTMLVMMVVFSRIFRFNVPNYPVYLITGQILYNFLSEATNNALVSIIGNAPLLKKTYVPKYIFTLSKVTSALVNLVFSLGALLIVLVITHVQFTWYMLLFPFVILEIYVFCLGLGMFLAQGTVFFRDVQYIYSVMLTAWMYATPIFYPAEALDGTLGWIIRTFNPMFSYISQFRAIFLYGTFPDLQMLGLGIGYAVLLFLFGSWCFIRSQDKFVLYI